MRKPYFKKSHQAWYVNIDGRPVKLGRDKEAAEVEYHRLMADRTPVTSRTTVKELLDQFLVWTKDNRAKGTYGWYLFHLQRFADFIGPKMQVAELLPGRVDAWLKKDYREASDTGKNGAVRALSRAFNWARKQRLIRENPLSGMERPAAEPREVYLTEEQWKAAVGSIRENDPLLDLVHFLRETGCRPFEARIAEARHWDGKGQIIFERRNSKGKRTRRVVRLNEAAHHIIRKLALKHPDGPLFRNRKGKPWTASGIDQAFRKIAKKVGFSFFPYAVRHAWCTDALMRGVDPVSVSVLMGHKDAKMVMQVYSHLCQQDDFLEAKLRQATGGNAASGVHP